MPTAQVLAEVRRATRHHGVARSDDLRLSRHQLARCCQAGVLLRPHHDVYVDPAAPRGALQDLAIAVAAGGRLASAWGRSAAALWGLIDEHPARPEIVVPRQRFAKLDGAVVHRSSGLCFDHVTQRHHIRTTKPLVTALDLGVVLSPMDLADVLVTARQLRFFEPDAVWATIHRLSKPGRTGIRVTRQALELMMIGDRPADSILELRFHHGPGQLGIPPYVYQHEVRIAGKTYRIDFAYPDVRLALEIDGFDKRRSLESLTHDASRSNALVLAGWEILHFTWPTVVNQAQLVATQVIVAHGNRTLAFRA